MRLLDHSGLTWSVRATDEGARVELDAFDRGAVHDVRLAVAHDRGTLICVDSWREAAERPWFLSVTFPTEPEFPSLYRSAYALLRALGVEDVLASGERDGRDIELFSPEAQQESDEPPATIWLRSHDGRHEVVVDLDDTPGSEDNELMVTSPGDRDRDWFADLSKAMVDTGHKPLFEGLSVGDVHRLLDEAARELDRAAGLVDHPTVLATRVLRREVRGRFVRADPHSPSQPKRSPSRPNAPNGLRGPFSCSSGRGREPEYSSRPGAKV